MDRRRMSLVVRAVLVLCTLGWALAFALPSTAATPAGSDSCGYPSSDFTESTVMRWAQVVGSGTSAQIAAYGNDEKGLLLGVNGATPMSSATPNGTNGQSGGTSYHVSNASGGSPTATDPSGRPYFPALYITNLTAHPLNSSGQGAGDFQSQNTSPRNIIPAGQPNAGSPFINDVFGTWSTATVGANGANYTVTPPLDKNDWNLGTGSDAPVGTTFSAMGDEGYGAEVRWNASALTDSDGNALVPGNTYRIQIIEHDGDQNKTGGDAGEFCVNLTIPGAPGISVTKTQKIAGSSSAFTHNPVYGKVGDTVDYQMVVTNTGTVSESYTFSDPQCDANTLSPASTTGTLAAKATVTYTCSHQIKPGDSATGVTNTACATTSGVPQACDTVVAHVPAITLVKGEQINGTGSYTHGPVTGVVGDTVNYQMTVTNTGDTPLTLTFTDGKCDFSSLVPSTTTGISLAAGQSTVWTCHHSPLTSSDAPAYTNTANVVGTAPDGTQVQASDSVVANVQVPGLSVVKLERIGNTGQYVAGPVYGKIGDTVNYQMTVTNTGNVSEPYTLSDPQCDTNTLSPTPASGNLAAGQSAIYTCSHILKSSDTASGFTNTACATTPNAPQACSTVVAHVPAITLVKLERIGSASFTHGPITGNPGDTVNYQMTVTNAGDTPLTLNFTDMKCDAAPVGPNPALTSNTLPVGGSVQYTCSHLLASTDAPTFTNTANVVGTAPDGTTVQANDSVDANVHLAPGLSVVKAERIGDTGAFVHGPVYGKIGDKVEYQMTVTNTGNVAESFTFSDPQCDANTLQGPTPSLPANGQLGVGQAVVYTCSHILTSSDTASGYTNTACATPTGGSQSCDTVVTHVPAITLVKAERIGSASFTHGPVTGNPGDTVDYQMTVTNAGDTPLTLNFTDAKCDAGTLSGPSPALSSNTLPVGGSVQYTCSHQLASGDAPAFTNTANVVGTAPDGTQVQATDSVVANLQLAPAIALTKLERIGSASFTHGPVTGNAGDVVDYQMTVANTGNTPLVIDFTDNQCDSGTLSLPSVVSGTYDAGTRTLSVTGVLRYTCSHTLAEGDQPYINAASVTGTAPNGQQVSDQDSVKAFANVPGLNVVKLQRDGDSGSFTTSDITANVGDTVNYEIQVTNTGTDSLTLSLADRHCDAGTIQGPTSISGTLSGDTLSAGGVAQYTCSHVVGSGDVPQYTNTAIVTGTPPSGPPLHGTGIVVANIPQAPNNPAIHVLKLASVPCSALPGSDINPAPSEPAGVLPCNGPTSVFTHGTITIQVPHSGSYSIPIDYEIQVTNTGNVPLTLTPEDSQCDTPLQGPTAVTGTLTGSTLSAGGRAFYTCSHAFTPNDPAALTNTATVTGQPPNGAPVHGTSTVTTDRVSPAPPVRRCRSIRTGRLIRWPFGHRKPRACRAQPGHSGHGFTG